MRRVLARLLAAVALALTFGGQVTATQQAPPAAVSRTSADPLAAEIARWSDYIRTNTSTDELWTQARQAAEPALSRAEQAMREGRRLLALQRFAAARELLAAHQYVARQPARGDAGAFEAEWARLGKTLDAGVAAARSSALARIQPAAHRAMAEAALAQVKVYRDASLEYGRNTMPENGFFYLGTAAAQLGLVELLVALSAPVPAGAPRRLGPRSLTAELDALESDLLAAYRPPASVERHPEFIRASATLKEARELDAAGQHHGALLQYLQAATRIAPLRSRVPAPAEPKAPPAAAPSGTTTTAAVPPVHASATPTVAVLKDCDSKLSKGGEDHSLARLFLEDAQATLEDGGPNANPAKPAIIANDVLPRYLAALEPAKPAPTRPAAAVTVTLVRWPYT